MDVTHSFALLVQPRYLSWAMPTGSLHFSFAKRDYSVSLAGATRHHRTELEAWQDIQRTYSLALETLSREPNLSDRALAVRGALLLGLSSTGVTDMLEKVYAQMRDIFQTAVHALDAAQVGRAEPRIRRCSFSQTFSWYEVSGKVTIPTLPKPFWLRLRVLPSPIEEDTWAVRIRVPSTSNHQMRQLQQQFDDFVRLMAVRRITIKDVFNGCMVDL